MRLSADAQRWHQRQEALRDRCAQSAVRGNLKWTPLEMGAALGLPEVVLLVSHTFRTHSRLPQVRHIMLFPTTNSSWRQA